VNLNTILLILHSAWRWVLVIVALIALVFFLIEWLRNREFSFSDRRLMLIYTATLDIQVLLGLILILWSGLTTAIGFPMYRIEHAVTMIIAVIVAHLNTRWRDAPMPARARTFFLLTLASLAIIILGVARLPAGWTFRM